MLKIKVENCNNIKEGEIELKKSKLNIKYGMNGTGKTTLALAIENKNIENLKTFGSDKTPIISFSEEIRNVVTFDSRFVDNIVFKEDEVITDAFNVFIKSDKYDEKRAEILNDLKELNKATITNEKINTLYQVLKQLKGKLKLRADHDVYLTNEYKSILRDENFYRVPEKLKKFEGFFNDSEKRFDWIAWKTQGFNFDENHICPFCTEKLQETYTEEKQSFTTNFKKNDVKNLTELKNNIDILKDFMVEEQYTNLVECITDAKSESEINVIFRKFIVEFEYLLDKLENIVNFDSYNMNESAIANLENSLEDMKINFKITEYFGGDKYHEICKELNAKIDELIRMAKKLKSEIGSVNGIVKATIEKNKSEINEFLKIAGFKYEVEIRTERDGQATVTLKHNSEGEKIDVPKIRQHLSWGERNAFALVLFMFYAISKNPDIIILDDPISSFDANKKYAIIDRLFLNQGNRKSLNGHTVLMLTHDFEPIIDFVQNGKPHNEAFVKYIRNNNGIIEENIIQRSEDVKLTIAYYYECAKNITINIVSRVAFLRKYIELSSYEGKEENYIAYNILSCLIHCKDKITTKAGKEFSEEEIKKGNDYIKTFIPEFDYFNLLKSQYTLDDLIKLYQSEKNTHFKLQIFRQYIEIKDNRSEINNPLLKFADNVYHIENDYIYTLDFVKHDIIPSFIINEVDSFMAKEGE